MELLMSYKGSYFLWTYIRQQSTHWIKKICIPRRWTMGLQFDPASRRNDTHCLLWCSIIVLQPAACHLSSSLQQSCEDVFSENHLIQVRMFMFTLCSTKQNKSLIYLASRKIRGLLWVHFFQTQTHSFMWN